MGENEKETEGGSKADTEGWGLDDLSPKEREEWLEKQKYLSAEDVQKWFKAPFNGKVPTTETAQEIAKYLFYASQALAIPAPDYSAEITAANLLQQIDKALQILTDKVESRLAGSNNNAYHEDSKLARLKELHISAKRVSHDLTGYQKRKLGRPPAEWHDVARGLEPLVVEAATSAGAKLVSFGKPTCPAVKVMLSALEWLSISTAEHPIEAEAIVEVMRKARRPQQFEFAGKAWRAVAKYVDRVLTR